MAGLDDVLTRLLAGTGASTARVVGEHGAKVLGAVGAVAAPLPDGGALVGLAGAARALGAGVEDVVVAGEGHVDVVRRIAPPGRAPLVVHLRLHPGRGDIGAARRALASTLLHRDLVDGIDAHSQPWTPAQRLPGAQADRPASDGRPRWDEQPALVTLHAGTRPPSSLAAASAVLDVAIPLPRRTWRPVPPPAPPGPALPGPSDQAQAPGPRRVRPRWASDLDTLRRLVTGLRQLD